MRKLTVLALLALVTLIAAPLAAAEAPVASTEAPAVVAAAPAPTATLAIPANTTVLPGALPFAPVNLSTCTDICLSEYNSCRLDCRFQPYPGCANDCWQEWQACLAGC